MIIFRFNRNLVLSLTQWWCSLFLFLNGNILFMVNLLQKIKIVCWSWNLETRLIRICRIRWWFSFYCLIDWKYLFWVNFVQKFKIFSLSWNWVPRLFRICKIRWWCSLSCFRPFSQVLSKKYIWHYDVTWLISQ